MTLRTFLKASGLLLLLGSVVGPPSALAQSRTDGPCGGHVSVAEKLKQIFDEQPTSIGLASSGAVIEIFTSPVGTWTIVLTNPQGVSCLMATGEHWEDMAREIAEVDS